MVIGKKTQENNGCNQKRTAGCIENQKNKDLMKSSKSIGETLH